LARQIVQEQAMTRKQKQTAPRPPGSTKAPVDDIARATKPSDAELDDDMLDRVAGGEPPDPCKK
jgi:hypothetical protein